MAGDWIKMRTGLEIHPGTWRIGKAVGSVSPLETVCLLYKLACWFRIHGKYGRIKGSSHIVDSFLGMDGFADALASEDWLREEHGYLILRGFTDVSAIRKSLGRKLRRSVLDGAVCAGCGAISGLVIDHAIPISRGGTSERSNLQALCSACNSKKGQKTMEEFLRDR